MKYARTAYNRTVTASPPYGGSGYEKPQSGLRPLCGFVSATVWAGVVATQRPITCPNRQLQPERYVPLQIYSKMIKKDLTLPYIEINIKLCQNLAVFWVL